jgi:hypothetical protein
MAGISNGLECGWYVEGREWPPYLRRDGRGDEDHTLLISSSSSRGVWPATSIGDMGSRELRDLEPRRNGDRCFAKFI